MPKDLPASATGDAALDALFDLSAGFRSPAVVERVNQLRARAAEPAIRAAAMRLIELILDDRPPLPLGAYPHWSTKEIADEALRALAQERVQSAASSWVMRSWIVVVMLEVLGTKLDDAFPEALAAWIDKAADPSLRGHVAQALLDATTESRFLEPLAKHFVPGDPLVGIASVAVLLLSRDDILARMRTMFATLDVGDRGRAAIHLSRRPEIDLDACPDWVDVLYPGVLGVPWAIEASYKLHGLRTSEPLLRALEYTDVDVYWTTILGRLHAIDDLRAAAPLEELAKTLPAQEKGKRLSRTSNTLVVLAKRLRRKRDVVDEASFETMPGMGTDGGPIVLLSNDVAGEWQGVPADWSGQGDSDYDRACAASDEGVGALRVRKMRGLAIGEQSLGVAMLADGATMLVVRGTDLQLEMAMREKGAWKKTRHVIAVGDQGAFLLDAAHTTASAPEGGSKALPLRSGRYDVWQLRTDESFALKLAPTTKKV